MHKLIPSQKPEVYLSPSSLDDLRKLNHGPIYLRTFTLAQYQKSSWSPLNETPQTFTAKNGLVTLNEPDSEEETISYEVYHFANADQNLAVTLPGLIDIEQSFLRRTGPAAYRLPPLATDQTNYRYQATSAPKKFSSLPQDVELLTSSDVSAPYLDLPQEEVLLESIKDISQLANGNIRERLKFIKKYLKENHRYSLAPENFNGMDPISNFLIGSREGYCEHFSTVGALLASLSKRLRLGHFRGNS